MIGDTTRRGTRITFKPDPLIFAETEISFDILAQRCGSSLSRTRGVRIDLSDERIPKEKSFHYEGGLSFLRRILEQEQGAPAPGGHPYFRRREENVIVEAAIQYNNTYNEKIFTFANNINTTEGGTHLVGFKAGLTRAIKQYAAENKLPKAIWINSPVMMSARA